MVALVLKISFTPLFLVISFALVSCGGGGSGASNNVVDEVSNNVPFSLSSTPDGVSTIYQGKREPALLTRELAIQLLKNIYYENTKLLNDSIDIDLSNSPSQNINETTSGLISGSLSLVGSINPTNGKLTATWTNYSSQTGYRTNGKAFYDIVEVDQANGIVNIVVSLNNLNIITPDHDLTSNGNIFSKQDFNRSENTTVFDLDIYEENTGIFYTYDKFKIFEEEMSNNHTATGRLYKSDVGYIDISTIEQLSRCVDANCSTRRPSKGILEFKGDNQSSVVFEFKEDDYQVPKGQINILTTNQNLMEPEKTTYNWRKMEPWKNENNSPELNVFFFSLYHTIENIEVEASASDQDRDEVEITYTWYVNDIEIVNDYIDALSESPTSEPNILPKFYFKAGDIVKVKVTANDGYYTDQEVSSTVIAPEILNVAPNILLEDSIPSSSFYVSHYVMSYEGNTGVLDASQSFDADGDTLEFKWTNDSNDQELIIHNPSSSKTNVTCGSTYGCKNICLKLEIEEFRNGQILNPFSDLNLGICFTN